MSDLSYVRNNDGTYSKLVQLSGSTVPESQPLPTKNIGGVIVSTIINAQSVTAGGNTGSISLGITTESEIWIQVNIDQQPWIMQVGSVNDLGGAYTNTVYPVRNGVTSTYPNGWAPATSLYLGLDASSSLGLTAPTNMADARNYLMRPESGATLKIINNSASVATVTVRIIRIWR